MVYMDVWNCSNYPDLVSVLNQLSWNFMRMARVAIVLRETEILLRKEATVQDRQNQKSLLM